MSRSLEQVRYATSRANQRSFPERATVITALTEKVCRTPKVCITGDIRFSVTESEVALRPVKGNYRINTEEMEEPLQVIWSAEGHVLHRGATSTAIEFDMNGARVGQTWTHVVAVQVTEKDGRGCIFSGIFVQIRVT